MASKPRVEIDPMMGSLDLSNELGVSVEHALQLMRSGRLGPVFNIGTGSQRELPRVRRSNVEAWIESCRVSA